MAMRRLFDNIKVRTHNRPARLFGSHEFVKYLLQCHTDMSRMIPSLTLRIVRSVRRCATAIGTLGGIVLASYWGWLKPELSKQRACCSASQK